MMEVPRLLFIGATHGDEQFGVRALEQLEASYDRAEYNYDWIVGNPRALELGKRFTEADLNRSAPGDANSPIYEVRRAAEIMEICKDYDAVIDIHGTVGACGITSIIPYPTVENIALARRLPIARNVIWYARQADSRGPITQFIGRTGLELECGPKDDPGIQRQLETVLGQIVTANAAIARTQVSSNQEFYEAYGLQRGEKDPGIQDFEPVTLNDETFYPYLSQNPYLGITCVKLRSVEVAIAELGLARFRDDFRWE